MNGQYGWTGPQNYTGYNSSTGQQQQQQQQQQHNNNSRYGNNNNHNNNNNHHHHSQQNGRQRGNSGGRRNSNARSRQRGGSGDRNMNAMNRSDTSSTSPRHRATKTPSQFTIDLNLLRTGVEKRTTIMVRNIPNRYTREGLIEDLQEFRGKFDFFYLPMDLSAHSNVGYAFINFVKANDLITFYNKFHLQKIINRYAFMSTVIMSVKLKKMLSHSPK